MNRGRQGAAAFEQYQHSTRQPGLTRLGPQQDPISNQPIPTNQFQVPVAPPSDADDELNRLAAIRGSVKTENGVQADPRINQYLPGDYRAAMNAYLADNKGEKGLAEARAIDPNFELKQAFAAAGGDYAVTDAAHLASLLKTKAEDEQWSQFLNFITEQFDPQDAYQLQQMNKIAPFILEDKIRTLEAQFDVDKRIARISMTGVQSLDDIKFMWMVNTGQLKGAREVYGRNGAFADDPAPHQNYNPGYFNPMQSLGNQARQNTTMGRLYPMNQNLRRMWNNAGPSRQMPAFMIPQQPRENPPAGGGGGD